MLLRCTIFHTYFYINTINHCKAVSPPFYIHFHPFFYGSSSSMLLKPAKSLHLATVNWLCFFTTPLILHAGSIWDNYKHILTLSYDFWSRIDRIQYINNEKNDVIFLILTNVFKDKLTYVYITNINDAKKNTNESLFKWDKYSPVDASNH